MKTAVSLPDGVFEAAERLAARLKMSRSKLYATALEAFLARHPEAAVTEQLNRVYGDEASDLDPELMELQRRAVRAR